MHTETQLEIIDELLRKERGLVIRADGELELISGVDLAAYRAHQKPDSTLEFVGPGGWIEDPHIEWVDRCRTCEAAEARACLVCAREGRGAYCSHPEEVQIYCEHCARNYPAVAATVDEFALDFMERRDQAGEPQGLNRADFIKAWTEGGTRPAELRLAAGFLHGWTTQTGNVWRLPEVQAH